MTQERLQALITAGALLVNVLGVAFETFAKLFKGLSVTPEERAKIYAGILADADVRAKRAEAAAGASGKA